MADGPKTRSLSKAEVLAMTGMSGEQFDKRSADARGPQKDNTWKQDGLSPSQGGGLRDAYSQATSAQEPLQPRVGAMANEPAPAADRGIPEVTRQRMMKAGLE